MPDYTIYNEDWMSALTKIEPKSVQCVVTSPPYWGLRDYGTATWIGGDKDCDHQGEPIRTRANINQNIGTGIDKKNTEAKQFYREICKKCGAKRIDDQLGLEKTPEEYIEKIVKGFRLLKECLRDDGIVWLNLGDSYAGSGKGMGPAGQDDPKRGKTKGAVLPKDLKPKDLCMIPARVALALQADGWYLRSVIIWEKQNPMPESVTDRPTTSHEYIYLLSKSATYYYDAEAIKETTTGNAHHRGKGVTPKSAEMGGGIKSNKDFNSKVRGLVVNRNRRSVWNITTKPYIGAHFATFPADIPELCIKAGTSEKGCCAKCGTPWERLIYKQKVPRNELPKDDPRYRPNRYKDNKYSSELREEYESGMYTETQTLHWQPTCNCFGKRVKKAVIIPPRVDDASAWGTDANGEYNGIGQKDYEEGMAQNPSDVKKRIIENATKERETALLIYESEIPLKKHEIKPCIVLDPFCGSGTTGEVALRLGRHFIGIELNTKYVEELIKPRLNNISPLFKDAI